MTTNLTKIDEQVDGDICVVGIQAKLYNQDLSLDASFDAGGNMGR